MFILSLTLPLRGDEEWFPFCQRCGCRTYNCSLLLVAGRANWPWHLGDQWPRVECPTGQSCSVATALRRRFAADRCRRCRSTDSATTSTRHVRRLSLTRQQSAAITSRDIFVLVQNLADRTATQYDRGYWQHPVVRPSVSLSAMLSIVAPRVGVHHVTARKRLKVVPVCSWQARSICPFSHFCCSMYRLDTKRS